MTHLAEQLQSNCAPDETQGPCAHYANLFTDCSSALLPHLISIDRIELNMPLFITVMQQFASSLQSGQPTNQPIPWESLIRVHLSTQSINLFRHCITLMSHRSTSIATLSFRLLTRLESILQRPPDPVYFTTPASAQSAMQSFDSRELVHLRDFFSSETGRGCLLRALHYGRHAAFSALAQPLIRALQQVARLEPAIASSLLPDQLGDDHKMLRYSCKDVRRLLLWDFCVPPLPPSVLSHTHASRRPSKIIACSARLHRSQSCLLCWTSRSPRHSQHLAQSNLNRADRTCCC